MSSLATAVRAPTVGLVTEVGPSDGSLVARMVAGDDGALARVYDRYAGLVFGLARRVTADDEAAREVTQDVFTHLWSHPDRVDLGRGTLKAYLGVMAHRRAVDAVRAARRRPQADGSEPAGVTQGPDAIVVEQQMHVWQSDRLTALVGCLPEEERAAVTLAYYDGHTYREVAELLGIPEGTAKSRLRRALGHLRTVLQGEEAAWT